jgi:hypothetical protein
MGDIVFLGTEQVGSGAATRVQVQAPQGSCFDGQRGIVTRVHPSTDTVMVRLDKLNVELPFGRGELVVAR